MNIYSVVSEPLRSPDTYTEPGEPYAIAEIVVAATRDQARWMAWQTDSESSNDPRDMPKFRVHKLRACVDGPARVMSTAEPGYEDLWAESANRDPEALRSQVKALEDELAGLMSLVVEPWTREDGAELWKINLAWWDTAATKDEAEFRVRQAIQRAIERSLVTA